MFKTTSQIEEMLLERATDELKKDLETPLKMIKKRLDEYDVPDVNTTVDSIRKLLMKHINTDMSQACILHNKSEELITKLAELEDMIYDTCADGVQQY